MLDANDEKRELLKCLMTKLHLSEAIFEHFAFSIALAGLLDGSLLFEVEYFVCCEFFPHTPNPGKAFCLVAMMKKS